LREVQARDAARRILTLILIAILILSVILRFGDGRNLQDEGKARQ